jgi:predicted enzyme related to lactoylglutathione lyase
MTVFNVQVDDVPAACDTVAEAGGSVVVEPQEMPNGLAFAYVADPDGSVFGLWKPPTA